MLTSLYISHPAYSASISSTGVSFRNPPDRKTNMPSSADDDRASNHGQLSTNLPGVTTFLTGHDAATGKAIVHAERPGSWTSLDKDEMAFNVVFTTSQFPASVNNDADIKTHDALLSSKKLGLVNPGGYYSPGYSFHVRNCTDTVKDGLPNGGLLSGLYLPHAYVLSLKDA